MNSRVISCIYHSLLLNNNYGMTSSSKLELANKDKMAIFS